MNLYELEDEEKRQLPTDINYASLPGIDTSDVEGNPQIPSIDVSEVVIPENRFAMAEPNMALPRGEDLPDFKPEALTEKTKADNRVKEIIAARHVGNESGGSLGGDISPVVSQRIAKNRGVTVSDEDGSDLRFAARFGEAASNLGHAIAGVDRADPSFYRNIGKEAREDEILSQKLTQQSQIASQRTKAAEANRKASQEFNWKRDREKGKEGKEQAEILAGRQDTKKTDDDARHLSEALNKEGLGELDSVVDDLESRIEMDGKGDIAGFGLTAAVPDFKLSKPGQRNRQAVAALRNVILKARSGGSVTEDEAGRMLEEIGGGITRTDAQLRTGLKGVIKQLQAKQKNILAGYNPKVISEFEKRGGKTKPLGGGKTLSKPKQVSDDDWAMATPEEKAQLSKHFAE